MTEIVWKRKERAEGKMTGGRAENTGGHPVEMKEGPVPYLYFPLLDRTGLVRSGFSTKLGGVSEGDFTSMNLGISRGDDPGCVRENFRRMGEALGIRPEQMTLSWQTHTVHVRRAGREDMGKGVVRERDYRDVDGMITDVPGLCLVTLYADCVPLYFLDPVHRAIGLSHSGWKGTVNRMGRATVERMREAYGTRPEDLLACIGPSICADCYEIGEDVAEAFRQSFSPGLQERILRGKGAGKYQLDLWEANRLILLEAGIPAEQIAVTDICTMCNSQWLFSHRATGGRRGNLGAFLYLL